MAKELAHAEPLVSVVIPTYNRCDLVVRCLESLGQQWYPALEIIVVDDASTDGTAAHVGEAFPQAMVVRMARNSRFAAATNAGIRHARGDWIFLLNNDVTLDPDCIGALVRAGEASGAAMVGPLILWQDTPGRVFAAGDRITAGGRPESLGYRAARAGFEPAREVFGITAAAGLYRAELFEQCGLLDEGFIAYFEDSDLALRARLAGFEAILEPAALAYHIGSASIAGMTWWRSRQCYRNHALLVWKNVPAPLLFRLGPSILRERAHQMKMAFGAARAAFGARRALVIVLAAWLEILWAMPAMWRKRRAIQGSRRISLAALRHWMVHGTPPPQAAPGPE